MEPGDKIDVQDGFVCVGGVSLPEGPAGSLTSQ